VERKLRIDVGRKFWRLFRKAAENSTAHQAAKIAARLARARFSTNPQRSSQQQVLQLSIFKKIFVVAVKIEQYQWYLLLRWQCEILSNAHFHKLFLARALYTFLKNEYSTLYGVVHRRTHDRNGNCTRGKPIHGIQRNQVSPA
jgi:hypothetical protein